MEQSSAPNLFIEAAKRGNVEQMEDMAAGDASVVHSLDSLGCTALVRRRRRRYGVSCSRCIHRIASQTHIASLVRTCSIGLLAVATLMRCSSCSRARPMSMP